MNIGEIPQELRDKSQWVKWRNETRNGEPTKVPYQANGKRAKINDPATWTTFQSAFSSMTRADAGVGYVFHTDDPYVGIDLDGCRDPQTGKIQEWARAIVIDLASYAEVSPSGTGVKIWVRGKWGPGKKRSIDAPKVCQKAPAIEIYDSGRYFVVTGNRLEGELAIVGAQAKLDALRTKYFPDATPAPPAESNGESHDLRSDAAVIERARKYIQRLPRAISGQGGHNATFRCACVLVCGFTLNEGDALALLSEWNGTHCDPPWRDHDLAHKIRSAMKQPGERGYLRNAAPKNYPKIAIPDYVEVDNESIAPEPLVARAPFPVHALPFPMRTIVSAVSDCTQTPPEMAGLAAIATAAGCIGNQAIVRWKRGFDQPAVLWGASIAKSGTNKSAPLALITAPLDARAERIGDEHATTMQAYAEDMAQHKARVEEWKKGGGKGSMPKAPPAPIQERVTTDDFTFERLVTLSAENPRGLLIAVDELGSWALGMNQHRGGKGADQQGFLTAYDARPRTRDRQKPNGEQNHTCVRVPRFAVSIIGTIQPRVFARLFGQQERDAGLLARLLVIDPPETYPDLSDDELDDAVAGGWADTLERLLTFNPPADGKIKPIVVYLAPDAKDTFRMWHDDVQAEMRRGIPDDDLRAYYGKLKGCCLRIGLLFHCVECTARGGDPAGTPISVDTMTRAICVTEWFRRVAVRVYGMLAEDDAERETRELVEWIARHGGSVAIRDLRTRFRGDTAAARRAAADLETRGFGRIERVDTGGRPSERFILGTPATKRSGTPSETSGESPFSPFGSGSTEIENADEWVEV